MRAVICRAWGAVDDLKLEDVPVPVPADDEVLIEVRATSVNYADSIMVAGKYQTRPPFPFSPGRKLRSAPRHLVDELGGPAVRDLGAVDPLVGLELHPLVLAVNVVELATLVEPHSAGLDELRAEGANGSTASRSIVLLNRPRGREARARGEVDSVAARSRVPRPVWNGRLPPPQRSRRLIGLPDRNQVPPPVVRQHREVFDRAAAPVGDEARFRWRSPHALEVILPQAHRRDLAPGERSATAAVGVEPDGRGYRRLRMVTPVPTIPSTPSSTR
jgi:hypothetical protein